MEGISWLEIAGGVVVTLTAVWGLVKVWVKITPTTADELDQGDWRSAVCASDPVAVTGVLPIGNVVPCAPSVTTCEPPTLPTSAV